VGVCLIRIEAQGAAFLITVRRNPDIDRRSGEVVTAFSEVELALLTVRGFLEQFSRNAATP
jgi:hypothetical protein